MSYYYKYYDPTLSKGKYQVFYKHKIVEIIKQRDLHNMDTRVIVEGESGIGKSYFALRIAEHLDQKFIDDPEKAVQQQVCFKASEYLKAVTILPPFSVLIYDEPGQTWHHREFMSEANIVLSKTIIGYRFKRFKSFLCIPTVDMIDKDARKLVHFLVNMLKQGIGEIYKVEVQKFGGPPWYKGSIDTIRVELPSVKLRHAYEKKKQQTQDELYESFHKKLSLKEKPTLSTEDILEDISKDITRVSGPKGIDTYTIMTQYSIGRDRATAIRRRLEKQGESETPV